MKKKILILLCILCLINTTGCNLFETDEIWDDSYKLGEIIEYPEETLETIIKDENLEIIEEESTISEITENINSAIEQQTTSETEKQTTEETQISTNNQTNKESIENFYYKQLTENQKQAYNNLLKACNNYESEIYLGNNLSEYEIYKVLFAYQNENPLCYWIDNFTYKTINKNKNETNVYITFNVPIDAKETTEFLKNKATNIVDNIPKNYSEYEKIKYIYEYILDNTEYVEGAEYNQDIRSVLINKKSVCSGYAYTFQYLCQLANINCVTVCGDATTKGQTGPHAWSLLYIDNNYYWIDTTWGDSFYSTPAKYDYTYLLTTDDILLKTHKINDKNQFMKKFDNPFFEYPKCQNNKYEYYSLNNSYFESYNDDTKNYIINKFKNNETIINIKFKDKNSLDNAYNKLFEEKEMHDILAESVDLSNEVYYRYMKIEDNNIILIWLE